jgi:hypothetical protein
VVITNEYHPYINDLSSPSIFFIEGVACTGEIKSILTSNELVHILENCLAYKRLSVNIPKGTTIYTNPSDRSRFVEKRPYFLFAFESQLTIGGITDAVQDFNTEKRLAIPHQIDAIFLLDRGCLINLGDGKAGLSLEGGSQGVKTPC